MQDTPNPGNGADTVRDDGTVEETPTTAQQFPPTLVGLDPPTLPAADGLAPPHRNVDNRGPADLPQFRSYPEPQRSVPGHPTLRRALLRLLSFGRRG